MIRVYRILASPVLAGLGARCRFYPSCSEYALEVFSLRNFWPALGLVIWRVLKCGTWNEGGFNPATPPNLPNPRFSTAGFEEGER